MHNSSTARRKGPDTDPWSLTDIGFKLYPQGLRRFLAMSVTWDQYTLEVNPGSEDVLIPDPLGID